MADAESSTHTSPTAGPSTSNYVKRAAIACTRCQLNRKKCMRDARKQSACVACVLADDGEACIVRDRARPNRGRRKAQAISASTSPDSRHVSVKVHPLGPGGVVQTSNSVMKNNAQTLAPPRGLVHSVQEEVERMYTIRTGLSLDLSLPVADLHSQNQSLLSSASFDALDVVDTTSLVNIFVKDMNHALVFLDKVHLWGIHAKMVASTASGESTLTPGEAALLDMVCCLGTFRALTFDDQSKKYVPPLGGERLDELWYRQSCAIMDSWEGASLTALQALFLQYIYISSTGNSAKARRLLGKAIRMAHDDLKLNRIESTETFAPQDKAHLLYFFIYFADWYVEADRAAPPSCCTHLDDRLHSHSYSYQSAICGLTPLVSLNDFDSAVLDPQLLFQKGAQTRPGGRSLPDLVKLVLIQGDTLSALASNDDPDLVTFRKIDRKLTEWVQGRVPESASASWREKTLATLCTIHFNWCVQPFRSVDMFFFFRRLRLRDVLHRTRLMLYNGHIGRNPLLADGTLTTLLARSAVQIIEAYHEALQGHLNFPFHQLQRVITAAYVLLLSFVKGEMRMTETNRALSLVCNILQVLHTRWHSAEQAHEALGLVVASLGLSPLAPLIKPNDALPPFNLAPPLSDLDRTCIDASTLPSQPSGSHVFAPWTFSPDFAWDMMDFPLGFERGGKAGFV
ncbi:BZ3500_MvSof-1268-A1-R1_Chr4-1g06687 [Microbotryum saponariae]|uniref:BZ3500_MvSof-1268-A1-R1_Chr4-1g06687 protein n=1 Tax=Microbotryum saponariae TaxID=289078 RepID=A0A2X0MVQ7_9BASI|nr:BZ3500_MvSof-1268-A1-R1_Chr4-1g06687 [Microbotryum saponariae]SDA06352.1 BZ3501_MvSof-1269-A2-R1_Chr4-1g06397 [Microbotryum saponariae]